MERTVLALEKDCKEAKEELEDVKREMERLKK